MKSLEWVAILEEYKSLMISCAGKKFLIADIFKNRINPHVHNQMLAVGKTIGEVI